MEFRDEGIRTMIEGDFNARIGEEGGVVEEEEGIEGRKVEGSRKTIRLTRKIECWWES